MSVEKNGDDDRFRITRRTAISAALAAAGGAQAFGPLAATTAAAPSPPTKRYDMAKSINLWAFPYPDKMSLEQCLQLANDAGFRRHRAELRPRKRPLAQVRHAKIPGHPQAGRADRHRISGVCSFLFWPYPLTSNDPAMRARSLELAGKMIEAAHDLGTENLWWCPAP